MQIHLTCDSSGVMRSFEDLYNAVLGDAMGRVLHAAASMVWVPKIIHRLKTNQTSVSGWENDDVLTIMQRDPDFVQQLGPPYDWAERDEQERRGYKPGKEKEIENAIKASQPYRGSGYVFVGIGDISLLDSAAKISTDNPGIKLWKLLQWGTGIYGKEKRPIVRYGRQIFLDRRQHGAFNWKPVLVEEGAGTYNEGFMGREFFVQLDGDIHESDFETVKGVREYITKKLKQYSYKG